MLERYFIKPQTVDRIRSSWLGGRDRRPCRLARGERVRRPQCPSSGADAHALCAVRSRPRYVHARRRCGACRSIRRALGGHASAARSHEERQAAHQGRGSGARGTDAGAGRSGFRPLARRLGAPQPFVETAPGFFDYLHRERGLSDVTLRQYGAHLRRFEKFLDRIGLRDPEELSPTVLSGFVVDAGRELSKGAMSGLCSHLRVFLGYLHRERVLTRDLADSVDSPRLYRLSTVPRSVSWEDVERLLQGVDRRTTVGRRDYAILLLLVTYGLRAAEVAGLTLDSFDWDRERLEIPDRKAGHHAAFPLSAVVGEAIVDYLRHGRPASSERALFLQAQAPFRPVGFRVVADRATRHLRNAGIEVARPGSHTLRHSCVRRLVEAQFPLKTIGDYVGHRRPKSTEVYAKLDLEALREVALGDGEALA